MTNTQIIAIISVILFCCSCCEIKISSNLSPNGFWEQIGYGRIIELNDSIVKVYDVTNKNCDLSYDEEILDFGKIKSFTNDTLTIQHGIDNWLFIRLDELPELCNTSKKELKNDPRHNFEVFWNTFNEHYSSFKIKGIDWNNVYEIYQSKISKNTTDLELYTIFQEMISLLNDGHVEMKIPEHIEDEYKKASPEKRPKYSPLDEFELNESIAKLYVDSLKNYNSGIVRYGLIDKNTGYIQINAMLMLADYNLPKDLDFIKFYGQYWEVAQNRKDELQRQDEVDGINAVLVSIIYDFKGVKSCIIDLRFNIGGKDGAALAVLNHFSNKEKVVFIKKACVGNGFVLEQEKRVVPFAQRFTGKVYFLTSNRTASAAEILVLASLESPNIRRIGSTTQGIFSSTLDKKLPNGWEYELSNEVYQDLDGKNYENVGIAPDYKIEYSKEKDLFFDQLKNDLNNKKDKAIELALKLEKEIMN